MHACHDLCVPYEAVLHADCGCDLVLGHASKHGAAQHTGRERANSRAEEETSRLKQQ